MTRIVVVSRNPSLAWGLAAPERDLEEVRPHQIDVWLETSTGPPADLIVLDLTDASHSLTVLTTLRANAHLSPALLVAGDDPSWMASPLHDLPGAEVLPLPVTTDSLQAAVTRLMSGYPVVSSGDPADAEPASIEPLDDAAQPQESEVVATTVPEQRREPTPDPGQPSGAETETPLPPASPPPLRRSHPTSRAVREALAGADFSPQVAEVAHVAEASSRAVRPPAERTGGSPSPSAPWPPALDKPTRPMDNANALARALTLRVDELYGVPETGEVIVLDAVERTQANSAALLLPDGDRWRVAAGVGLGNVERRFELSADSWVVAHVARASKGVIIEDSDIARRPFASAPLASRRHLLAAPIRLVEGILLVARDEDPPFDEDALVMLAALAEESGLLLAAALDVRELARRMQPYTDYVD